MPESVAILLKQSAASFLSSRHSPARVRAMRSVPTGFDRRIWTEIAEAGWLGLRVPEADGGSGLGLSEAVALCEVLGAALLPEPFIACGLMPSTILSAGAECPRREQLVQQLIDGSVVFALAWQELPLQLDAALGDTRVTARDGSLTLSGRHLFVPSASAATDLFVFCQMDGQAAIVHVPASERGLSVETARLLDGSVGGTVIYDNVPVSPDGIVARGKHTLDLMEKVLNEARLAASAWLVGLSSRSLAMTLEYLASRVQFGRPIGSFQALQHQCVDLAIRLELTKATVRNAVALSQETSWDRAATSAAKASASETATLIARRSVQLHGGIGYADEADPGLYLKTALRFAGWLGNADIHRERFIELGGGRAHA